MRTHARAPEGVSTGSRVDTFLERLRVSTVAHHAVIGLLVAAVAMGAYGGHKTPSGLEKSAEPYTVVMRVVTPLNQTDLGAASTPTVPGQPFGGTIPATTSQVISVIARSLSSTSGTLQRWQRDETGAWHKVGAPIRASLGSAGLTTMPTDALPATPLGTWSLGLVVARDAGITRMPEHVLAPGDGWSSCTSCANYDQLSNSNELWAGRDSWARVAIHVLTNPRRVPGRSSGIFLHVGTSLPTSGCVGVPTQAALTIAGWLDPAAQPVLAVSLAR